MHNIFYREMTTKIKCIELLCECDNNFKKGIISEENISLIYSKLECIQDGVFLYNFSKFYFSDKNNIEWKFVLLNLNLFKSLSKVFNAEPNEMISVQECNSLKKSLRNLVEIGIYTKIEKNIPFHRESKYNTSDVFLNYNILKCTVYGLIDLLKCPDLRIIVVQECLRAILISLYQIVFCPLKKPSENSIMTLEMYNKLLEEKTIFKNVFIDLKKTILPEMYVKETMLILQNQSPVWLKKAVSQTLTTTVLSASGLDTIINAVFESNDDDNTKNWKSISVLVKIILSCRNQAGFKENIVNQLVNLLRTEGIEKCIIYERMFVQCTKDLFVENQQLCLETFFEYVMTFFISFSSVQCKIESCNLMQALKQHVRLVHGIFVNNSSQNPALPTSFLRKYINIILRLYACLRNFQLKGISIDLKEIILKYMLAHKEDFSLLLDTFLFEMPSDLFLSFRNDVSLCVDTNELFVNVTDYSVIFPISESSRAIKDISISHEELLVSLFEYLLNCLSNSPNYFKKFNADLLSSEDKYINELFEKKITIYKWLADLSENEIIQKKLVKQPQGILAYFRNIFEKAVDLKHHTNQDSDNDNFQIIFTSVMVLHSLLTNSSDNLTIYSSLYIPLNIIMSETPNSELKELINEIFNMLNMSKSSKRKTFVNVELSEVDRALEDICDPLLPVRGHGLMTLTKLVQAKDKCALERKQYIFNIFQQNLKQEDSFLYLNAINGLAAMANIFPDFVIQIICEEYTDFNKKDIENGHEVRVKIGEALVKTSKNLGEMVVKYKALLLNTFLFGAKDEDYLIRASSLSNLSEVCKLLGYKLGTVITEILVCIHSIIATDKLVEVRRAAVLVLRQIFVGCDREIIVFLKEDILPIYRELKFIYQNDKDDVMRLQAQLALEELNETIKEIVFPSVELSTEKKIIMM